MANNSMVTRRLSSGKASPTACEHTIIWSCDPRCQTNFDAHLCSLKAPESLKISHVEAVLVPTCSTHTVLKGKGVLHAVCVRRKALDTTKRLHERDMMLQLSIEREGVSSTTEQMIKLGTYDRLPTQLSIVGTALRVLGYRFSASIIRNGSCLGGR